MKKIDYPQPAFNGTRQQRTDATVKFIIAAILVIAAFFIACIIWNYFSHKQ